MAAKKNTKGLRLYNLLLSEVSKINKLIPEDRKLSLKERRQLISKRFYPRYSKKKGRVKLTSLRKSLDRSIRRLPKREGCDVLAIDRALYQDIPYYEIEQFVGEALPNCIYVKIEAKEFGHTNIFNTRDFNYYITGLSDITNRINEWVRQQNISRSGAVPQYSGQINLRPKKSNNGDPDNYYLEMVIDVGPRSEKSQLNIPVKKTRKSKKQQRQIVNKFIEGRLRKLKQQKSIFKTIRKKIFDDFASIRQMKKSKLLTKKQILEAETKSKKRLENYVRKKFTDGKITERKKNRFLKEIRTFFSKN